MATVTLTWRAPNSGGAVEQYKVYRLAGTTTSESAVKGGSLLTTVSSSTLTYADTSLASGAGAHSYTVTALNNGGAQESAGAFPTTQTL